MRVLLHAKSVVVNDTPGFVREVAEPDPHTGISWGPYIADADLTAEMAGRLCYLSGHRPNPKTPTNDRYLLNICAQKHYSVLGHASASFYIDGVSRNCTHEIIRHRWFTFSEVSQRYVDASSFEFVGHPGLEDLAGPNTYIASNFAIDKSRYAETVEELVRRGHTRKQARQAARQVLPGGTETKILMSGNLRAWRDFLAQRLAPGADLEIQAVAREIYKIMKDEFPNSFQDFDSHGMITYERLIKRALARHDDASNGSYAMRQADFIVEVRTIDNMGLWVLAVDPWTEEETERLGV